MRNRSSSRPALMGIVLLLISLPLLIACDPVEEPVLLEIRSGLQIGEASRQQVTLHDGENTWTTTADFRGNFRFRIRADVEPEADAFLWMTTEVDVGGEQALMLESLLGEYGELLAEANGSIITPDDRPRVLFSALRAVESAMLEVANDGQAVRSSQRLGVLIDEMDASFLLDGATALFVGIHADGSDWPDSVSSVRDLIANPALVAEMIWATGEARPDILARARASALRATDQRSGWSGEGELPEQYAFFHPSYPAERGEQYVFDQNGSGAFASPEGHDNFQWSLESGVVTLDMAGDLTWRGTETRNTPDGRRLSFDYTERYLSIELHRIVSGDDSDLVLVRAEIERVFDDEDEETTIRTPDSAYTAWRTPMDSLPIDAQGEWAMNIPRRGARDGAIRYDLSDNGMGEVRSGGWHSGETINWEDDDGTLRLLAGNNATLEVSFLTETRLGWFGLIVEHDTAGQVTGASVDIVHKGDGQFLQDELPGNYVAWGGNSRPSSDVERFIYELDQGGSGSEGSEGGGGRALGWVVDNGNVILRSCSAEFNRQWSGLTREPVSNAECVQYWRRSWDLVEVDGDDFLVLEHFQAWYENDLDDQPDTSEFMRVYFLKKEDDESAAGRQVAPGASLSQPIIDRQRDYDTRLDGEEYTKR